MELRFFMTAIIQLHAADFHHDMELQQGTSIVIFTHELCSSCRAWKQLLSRFKKEHPAIAVFEVDAIRDGALVNEFEVFHLPALFLYHNGSYHAPLQSELNMTALSQSIEQTLLRPAEEMP